MIGPLCPTCIWNPSSLRFWDYKKMVSDGGTHLNDKVLAKMDFLVTASASAEAATCESRSQVCQVRLL